MSPSRPFILRPVATALLGRGRLGPKRTLVSMVASFVVSLTGVLLRSRAPALAPHTVIGAVEPGAIAAVISLAREGANARGALSAVAS